MKNLIIVVDAWESWPIEKLKEYPEINEEANMFGYYINIMLKHMREDPNNTIIHFTWDTQATLMGSIDRTGEKIYYGLHEAGLDHPYPEYQKIYVCGFHYGICVENALNYFNKKYMHPWRYQNIGLIENMTLRHPRGKKVRLDLANSIFQHFYYSVPYGFILLDK